MRRTSSGVRGWLLLVIFAWALTGACVRGGTALTVLDLPQRNPTSYDFDYPISDLRSKALAAFEQGRQLEHPVFSLSPGARRIPDAVELWISTAEEPLFGSDLLRMPGNGKDLYLQNSHRPLWASPVYRGSTGEGLKFLAEFHVHFERIAERRTRVTVTAHRAEIVNGEYLSFGHIGLNWYTRYVSVPATTIEEFLVLKYLAEFAGVPLPPPILPRQRQGP